MSIASHFRGRLKSRELVLGSWMSLPHPVVAEMMSQVGLDFLLADGEHGPILPPALLDVLPGADRYAMPVIYRVPANRSEYIKAALDVGAAGVMVPMVNTADDALAAVQAAKYPPRGRRGMGAWRASNYYQDGAGYLKNADAETSVIVQIETVEAVHNVDVIAAVDGIDVLYLGPGDLALSQGIAPGHLAPSLIAAYEATVAAARRHHLKVGIDVGNIEFVRTYLDLGIDFLTYRADYQHLAEGARQSVAAVRTIYANG